MHKNTAIIITNAFGSSPANGLCIVEGQKQKRYSATDHVFLFPFLVENWILRGPVRNCIIKRKKIQKEQTLTKRGERKEKSTKKQNSYTKLLLHK